MTKSASSLVIVQEKSGSFLERSHHQPSIAISLVVKLRAAAIRPRRAAGRDQRGVKALVQGVEAGVAFAEPARGSQRRGAFSLWNAPRNRPPTRRRPPRCRGAPPRARSRLRISTMSARSARDRRHAKATVADRVDQAPRGEPRQRLAQRRRPDAITRGRLGDAEPRRRRESAPGECRPRSPAPARAPQRFRGVGVRSRQDQLAHVNLRSVQHALLFITSIHHLKSSPSAPAWRRWRSLS